MIEIRELQKRFGKLEVLRGIDLSLQRGRTTAILGPNGSGKTTLIKTLLGMVIPDRGMIRINDQQILNKYKYREQLNYLPQIANFPSNLSVIELLQMVADIKGIEVDALELLQIFGIQDKMHTKFAHLSGGTKQKVNIVMCFMSPASLTILDEPTTGLDPLSLTVLKKMIMEERNGGNTVILTSHIMSFVEDVVDDVVFLLDGKIYFAGAIDELRAIGGHDSLEESIAYILYEHDKDIKV